MTATPIDNLAKEENIASQIVWFKFLLCVHGDYNIMNKEDEWFDTDVQKTHTDFPYYSERQG